MTSLKQHLETLPPHVLRALGPVAASRSVRRDSLSTGAQLVTWSARQWVLTSLYGGCVGCDLHAPYESFDCKAALRDLHQMMCVISQQAARSLTIYHPDDMLLSDDERILLKLVSASDSVSGRRRARLAAGALIDGPTDSLCQLALLYRDKLWRAGLRCTGWGELQLVSTRR